jgi:hypothetical protein
MNVIILVYKGNGMISILLSFKPYITGPTDGPEFSDSLAVELDIS